MDPSGREEQASPYRTPSLPPDHPGEYQVPSLLKAARWQAWKLVGLSTLLLPVAALMTLLGACMGLPFLVLALAGMGFGLYRIFTPLSTFHELGDDRASRLAAALRIQAELRLPGTTRVPVGRGSLFMNDTWMVLVDSKNLILEPAAQLLWLWAVEEPKKILFIRYGTRRWINYHTLQSFPGTAKEMVVGTDCEALLTAIADRYPHLLYGYHAELFSRGRGDLIHLVEQRRQAGAAGSVDETVG